MTVLGPIPAADLGFALPHEHLFSIFGLDAEEPVVYDEPALKASVLPRLLEAKRLGVRALFDCTTAYFGRSPRLLAELSKSSGLHIVTNTGYYGAAEERYIPEHARNETAERIAERWTGEYRNGIGETGIRPGFVKLGVGGGPLSDVNRKLVEAGALTHRATGLTLAVHTADNPEGAAEQRAILRRAGVSPSAWLWTHAHAVEDEQALIAAAGEGAWLSIDGYRPERHDRFVELIGTLKENNLLHRVLLSHDANAYPRKGASEGGSFTPIAGRLLPALTSIGVTPEELHRMTVTNPAEAFAIRVRAL